MAIPEPSAEIAVADELFALGESPADVDHSRRPMSITFSIVRLPKPGEFSAFADIGIGQITQFKEVK